MFRDQLVAVVEGARSAEQIHAALQQVWASYEAGHLGEEAQRFAERLHARQADIRNRLVAGLKPVGGAVGGALAALLPASLFPRRVLQRVPDRSASMVRRRTLAYSAPLPTALAARHTVGGLAVLRIIADEVRKRGTCALCIAEIAARAGVSHRLVQGTIRLAERDELLTIQERRQRGAKNLPNVIKIISAAWRAWMTRGPRTIPTTHSPQGELAIIVPGGGGCREARCTEKPRYINKNIHVAPSVNGVGLPRGSARPQAERSRWNPGGR